MRTIGMLTVVIVVASLAQNVRAHCDSTSGPVIPEGKSALAAGDVMPVLKWIMPEHEDELVTAFGQAIAVRQLGPEARQLADQYFLETLVRLHRAGEGAPFTGITDDTPERIVALADRALAEASAEDMIARISALLATSIRERLTLAVEAKRNKDADVDAGRAFVEAYVEYVHYVKHVHAAIMSGGSHAH